MKRFIILLSFTLLVGYLLSETLVYPTNYYESYELTPTNYHDMPPRVDTRYSLGQYLLRAEELTEIMGNDITSIMVPTIRRSDDFVPFEVNIEVYILEKSLDTDIIENDTFFHVTPEDIYMNRDYFYETMEDYESGIEFLLDRPFYFSGNNNFAVCMVTKFIGISSELQEVNRFLTGTVYYVLENDPDTRASYIFNRDTPFDPETYSGILLEHNYLPELIFTYSEATLPVEMSSFSSCVLNNDSVKISWHTASESNVLGYCIFSGYDFGFSRATRIPGFIYANHSSQGNDYEFIDTENQNRDDRFYWIESNELSGETEHYGPMVVEFSSDSNDVIVYEIEDGIRGIYPNPFNSETTIEMFSNKAYSGSVKIYNYRGQLVRDFKRVEFNYKSRTSLLWDGRNNSGQEVSSGNYFAVMYSNSITDTEKIILMK